MGGRLTASGSTYSSYIAKNLAMKNKLVDDEMDPREALWKHAKAAEENPYWITPAYQKTAPATKREDKSTDESNESNKKQKTS